MAAVGEHGVRVIAETGTAGIVFDSAGEGDPHLLFLHGWCGDRSFFAPQFDHFARSHRVVSVDLPGHGESRAPATYTIDGLAADVAALGRQLGLGRGALVSHSLGAMVSLALAQQAPELVSAVIMVDPPPLSKEVWKDFAASLLPGFEGPDPATARRSFVEQMFLPTDDGDRRARIVKTMCAAPDDVAIANNQGDGRLRRGGGPGRLRRARGHYLVSGADERRGVPARGQPGDHPRPDRRGRSLPPA